MTSEFFAFTSPMSDTAMFFIAYFFMLGTLVEFLCLTWLTRHILGDKPWTEYAVALLMSGAFALGVWVIYTIGFPNFMAFVVSWILAGSVIWHHKSTITLPDWQWKIPHISWSLPKLTLPVLFPVRVRRTKPTMIEVGEEGPYIPLSWAFQFVLGLFALLLLGAATGLAYASRKTHRM